MPDLYGAPLGISAAIGDANSLGQLALQPLKARGLQAQVGLEEMQLQEEQNYAKALQQFSRGGQPGVPPTGGSGGPGISDTGGASQLESLANMTGQHAMIALEAGAPNKADALIKAYGTLEGHLATMASAKARQRYNDILSEQKETQWVASHAFEAHDQASFNALQDQYEQTFKKPSPMRGQPFTPDLPQKLADESLTHYQKLTVQRQDELAASLKAARESTERHQKVIEGFEATRAANSAERLRLEKLSGAQKVGEPSHGDLTEAGNIVKTDFPNLDVEDPATADQIHTLASNAKALLKGNSGFHNFNEAAHQAYLDMKAQGVFVKQDTWGGYGKEKDTVKRGGAQQGLAEKYNQPYDPTYEYREVNGTLQRKKKE